MLHYILQELKIIPSDFLTLSDSDKAFIIASCSYRSKKEGEISGQ